jgi:hypothetical protein
MYVQEIGCEVWIGLAGLGMKAVEGCVEDRNKLWAASKTEHFLNISLSASIKRPVHNEVGR